MLMEMLTSSLSTLRLHYVGDQKKTIVCDKAMVLVWCVQQWKNSDPNQQTLG
jgi:hypothetical protein